jgi:hypothetical protein
MASRQAAETTKLAALNSSAVAAPTASAVIPLAARPPIAAAAALPWVWLALDQVFRGDQ